MVELICDSSSWRQEDGLGPVEEQLGQHNVTQYKQISERRHDSVEALLVAKISFLTKEIKNKAGAGPEGMVKADEETTRTTESQTIPCW